MLQGNISLIVTSSIILIIALLIDLAFGEPPENIHPTVWMGKVIAFLKPRIKSESPFTEKLNGILLGLFTIALFTIPAHLMLSFIQRYLGLIAYIIIASLLLKPTFAIKCMEQYTTQIARAIEQGDIEGARRLLPYIVRRDPRKLNVQQIISATVESIAEGTVDGVTSPLFYYALFGVPGAISFRVINTLDSMVGYKDPEHINIGWFSAKLDTIANYIPARITALLMVVAAWLLGEDWKNSWKILRRDSHKTESLNAGWSMSAMAGALNVKLEKPGYYVLGDDIDELSPKHISRAIKIMKLTVLLFATLIAIPLLTLISTIVI
ncbi:MAG: cobalamin biosynthesis protein [archaeon YNP-LCB-003-016]|uniref:cobalamin biosynthesis protein n=1 Tax=Candidatus Culexarchaeum yellowstonense TaxID=2928963 RepID=UPI0026EF953C|nr:cobalamin biosynthesis protein [Candidatus Culexarchaeum yellowstonense]MCR6691703.1 cobalamin biosynthesis protein [Candidatus Culexarchaeum yellowstonense]